MLGLTQRAAGDPKEAAAVVEMPPSGALGDVGANAVGSAQQLAADYVLLESSPSPNLAMEFGCEFSGEPISRKLPKRAGHTELSAASPILSPCDPVICDL
jgi:hypothetical protein